MPPLYLFYSGLIDGLFSPMDPRPPSPLLHCLCPRQWPPNFPCLRPLLPPFLLPLRPLPVSLASPSASATTPPLPYGLVPPWSSFGVISVSCLIGGGNFSSHPSYPRGTPPMSPCSLYLSTSPPSHAAPTPFINAIASVPVVLLGDSCYTPALLAPPAALGATP